LASYTPPKGGVDLGETPREAAIRETLEEVGIKVDESRLSVSPMILEYTGKNGRKKKMYLYEYVIAGLHELGLDSDILPKSMLQEGEIDWAGFVDRDGAKDILSPVFWPVFDKKNDL
jgi:8-oxo-dGTP pyrophosphatase MutT (NUDIX family)